MFTRGQLGRHHRHAGQHQRATCFRFGRRLGLQPQQRHGTVADDSDRGVSYYGFLLANNTNVDVTGNTFANIVNPDPTVGSWGAGVRTFTPGPEFGLNLDGNTFIDNAVGLGIRVGSDVDPGAITITNNVFTGDSQSHIVNQGLTTTDVTPGRHQQLDSVLLSRATDDQLSRDGRPGLRWRGQCQLRLGRAQGWSCLCHGE